MLNPLSASEVVKFQYQDRLKEAEMWHLYRQLNGNRPGFLQRISQSFEAAIQWLRTHHTPSNLAEPCLSES